MWWSYLGWVEGFRPAAQHLERRQHQARCRAHRPPAHESGWHRGVRSPPGGTLPYLLIRTAEHRIRKRTGAAISLPRRRLEILSVTTAVVPAGRHLVGGQRETRRDAGEAAGHPDRRFRGRENRGPLHAPAETLASYGRYQLNFTPNCMARGSVCTFVILPNWQPNWCNASTDPSAFGGRQ